jgi:hypothetical protein
MWREELALAGIKALVITQSPKQIADDLLYYGSLLLALTSSFLFLDAIVITREVFKNQYLKLKKKYIEGGRWPMTRAVLSPRWRI